MRAEKNQRWQQVKNSMRWHTLEPMVISMLSGRQHKWHEEFQGLLWLYQTSQAGIYGLAIRLLKPCFNVHGSSQNLSFAALNCAACLAQHQFWLLKNPPHIGEYILWVY